MELGKQYKRGETVRTPLEFLEEGKFIRCKVEFSSGTIIEKIYWRNARQILEGIEL